MVYTSAFTVKAAEPIYSYQKHRSEAYQDQNNELVSRDFSLEIPIDQTIQSLEPNLLKHKFLAQNHKDQLHV